MKNILFLSILVAIQASAAFAGTAALGLGDEASEQLEASARQVIQAGVDSDIAAEVTRVLVLNGFKDEQVLRAHAILIKAQRAGLPLQPIVNKAFEGIAKQVPPDTILNAMEAVRSRYDFAFLRAGLLTAQKDQIDRLGQALAAGIAAGVSLEDADAMVEAVRQRAAATNPDQAADLALAAFETARDAARLGVSSTAAAGLVTQAMSKGLSPAEMQAMHQSFLSQSQHALPENIAKSYSSAIQQGKSFQGHGAVPGGLHGTPGPSSGHGGAGSPGPSGGAGGAGSGGGPGGSGGGGGGAGGAGGGGGGGGGAGGGGSGGGAGR
ncbi:MAG: hypothetical protein WAK95_05585 [Desulfobacterales bacterium]